MNNLEPEIKIKRFDFSQLFHYHHISAYGENCDDVSKNFLRLLSTYHKKVLIVSQNPDYQKIIPFDKCVVNESVQTVWKKQKELFKNYKHVNSPLLIFFDYNHQCFQMEEIYEISSVNRHYQTTILINASNIRYVKLTVSSDIYFLEKNYSKEKDYFSWDEASQNEIFSKGKFIVSSPNQYFENFRLLPEPPTQHFL